jgi:hypothetical protein
MSMEGLPLTQTDKDRVRHCAGNDELVEKTIAELIKKQKAIRAYSHCPSPLQRGKRQSTKTLY